MNLPHGSTKLLVSVRSVHEARAALAGGAALVDLKEPDRGALGAVDAETIEAVLDAVNEQVPVSAALGELVDDLPPAISARLAYAKLGLARAARLADWQARWRAALQNFPATVAPVAVAYADWRLAQAPPPVAVLEAAKSTRCAALLVDTYDKSAGDLLTHLPISELDPLLARARARGLRVVLGGSLDAASLPQVLELAPDYLAVRTAVCEAGRNSPLVAERVARLVRRLESGKRKAESGGG